MTDCIRKAYDVCLHAVFGHGAAVICSMDSEALMKFLKEEV